MPSLNALKEFRASFGDIGNQKANMKAKKINFEELELPDFEPEPMEMPVEEDAGEFIESNDAGDAGDLDFGAFIGTDDYNPPEELLSDFPVDETDEISDDSFDLGDMDLGSLNDLDTSEKEEPAEEPLAPDAGLEQNDFDLNGLDGLDFSESEEPEEAPEEAFTPDDGFDQSSFDLSGPDGLDFNEDGKAPSPDENFDTDGFDIFTEELENFDISGGEAESTEEAVAKDDDSDGFAYENFEDFFIPDLDDAISREAKTKKISHGKIKEKSKEEPAAETLEDITLRDDELTRLQDTLSKYPLNLRIACEEIISEKKMFDSQKMLKLIRELIRGVPAREISKLASEILERPINIPKTFEKTSGEALEAERGSFSYMFVHNFLPFIRLFVVIALLAASVFYLVYKFIYIPQKAESIYKMGYERIFAGEYQRANERFTEAFDIYRKKEWFIKYAEAFRDMRNYIDAEKKFEEMLFHYPRDKEGVLNYALMETYYRRNYAKAEKLLRQFLLDYEPDDPDGLLALGDNSLIWGEMENLPEKYDDARFAYARLLDKYGWTPLVVDRMMKYFIRVDNLKEVINIRQWFDADPKRQLSAESLAELGGYLLDKKLEEYIGVPDEYLEFIDRVHDVLLDAVRMDPSLPEAHYQLARYYNFLGSINEERVTLERAIRAFENAREESKRRLSNRIDAHQRYADVLIKDREFIPAEEQLKKGIDLFEDGISRRIITPSPEYGRLYAGLGDLEYFIKSGSTRTALDFYRKSEQNGWDPPEIQYRMGAVYYSLEDWRNALRYFTAAHEKLPPSRINRRLLFSLGNAALKQNNPYIAQAYYSQLIELLNRQRLRLPILLPDDGKAYQEVAERLMMAYNNAGVANEMLAAQTGDHRYINEAMYLYTESQGAWDSRTRDAKSMIRSASTPLPQLNIRNILNPRTDYEPQAFIRIDRDFEEASMWEHFLEQLPLF